MDHFSFFPFHNRHIKFYYEGIEMQGVVIDSIPYNEKEFSTQYVYIPTVSMMEWKEAENNHDIDGMRSLETIIDVSKITNPSYL